MLFEARRQALRRARAPPDPPLHRARYPIMTAGMGGVTLHELAAAASNAGGIGTLGAIPFTEKPCALSRCSRRS